MSLDKIIKVADFASHEEWLHVATGALFHHVRIGAMAGQKRCVRPAVCSLAMLAVLPALRATRGARALATDSDGLTREFVSDGVAFAPASECLRVALADLPDAQPENEGRLFFAHDDDGGTLYRSSGVAMEQIAASVNATGGGGGTDPGDGGVVATAWADRGVGAAVGEVKLITDLGNMATVEAIWDGERWQPRGGTQVIYSLREPLLGSNATTTLVNFPDVTIPPDLLGLYGGVALEWLAEVPATPTGRLMQVSFGGAVLCNDSTNAAVRTAFYARHFRNIGSVSSQLVSEAGQEHTGAYMGQVNRNPLRMAVNTAAAAAIVGGVSFTSAAAQAATLGVYRVTWVAG